MRADHDRHAAEAYVALFFLPLYLLTLKGFSTADDLTHYDLVQNIVGSGHLYLPPWKYDPETHPGMRLFAARGTDGHVYLGLPNGLAFASVPLGALGRAADGWVGSPSAPDPLAEPGEDGIREAMHRLRQRPSAILTAAINPVVTAITVALFFGLALQIARSVRDSLQVTLLLGLATVVWPYSTTYWTQPIAGLFLLAAFYMLCRTHQGSASRDALAGGLLAGGAFLCRYDTLPLASWLLAYGILRARPSAVSRLASGLSFAMGLSGALALQAAWNAYRFGDWLQLGTGHERWRDFQGDVLRVLPLQVISPYRGMLLYSPALLLGIAGLFALRRRAPALSLTLCGLSGTAVVVYSAFVMWRSNVSWGPRFLVPVTPFLLLPAAAVVRRFPVAFWTLLILGIGIQVPAVVGVQDPFVLSACHSPLQRDPWAHFWQSDVVAQWVSVLRGNVELWWLASPGRAMIAIALAGVGGFAAYKLTALYGSEGVSPQLTVADEP